MKLVIFAATDYSLLSLGVMEMALKKGHSIAGVVVRKSFSAIRLKEELAFGIMHSFKKLLKHLGRRVFSSKKSSSGLELFFNDNDLQRRAISSFCKEHGIPLQETSNLNNREVLTFLESVTPDLVVFGGGGIIREAVLSKVSVLNCHMGLLPKYRGNYPWVWALANKEYGQIGLSVHLMEARIDQGPIVENFPFDILGCKSLQHLVTALEFRMIPAIIKALGSIELSIQDIDLHTTPQEETDGRQYFMPHHKVMKLAEYNLKNHQRNLL
jgi:methionyl-tRNA formyltransferase